MKTAVEFLVEEFKQKLMGENLPDWVLAIIEQAKQMEKEQIIEAFVEVTQTTLEHFNKKSSPKDIIDFKKIAEVYYNETFKSE